MTGASVQLDNETVAPLNRRGGRPLSRASPSEVFHTDSEKSAISLQAQTDGSYSL